MCLQETLWQASRLPAKEQVISWLKALFPVRPRCLRSQKVALRLTGCLKEGREGGPHPHIHIRPVVESGPLQRSVIDGKPQRFHEVQHGASGQAKAGDVPRIGRNLGFDQDDVEHGLGENERTGEETPAGSSEMRKRWGPEEADPAMDLVRASGDRINVDPAAVAIETDVAIDEGEQGVIPATADVFARLPLGAALADDDGTGENGFTAETLHAEALAAGVATVLDTTLTFLVSHDLKDD